MSDQPFAPLEQAHVALDVAAAMAFHRLHGNTRAIATPRDYDEALNMVAGALSRLIPIYGMGDAREGRKALAVDLTKQAFVRGATRLRLPDGTLLAGLTVLRAELASAMSQLGKTGLPLLVAPFAPARNRLLAALPEEDYTLLAEQMELVPLRSQEVLYAENATLRYVYFPVSGVVSLLYLARDGAPTEIAVVGNDGLVGLAGLLGGGWSAHRAVVQIAGHAFRARAEWILSHFSRAGAVQDVVHRYIEALLAQIAQTAVCNRRHRVEQQLCRWLLLILDRVPENEVPMTQELIGNMLGVRRAAVTEAAHRLQQAGLIRYRRGRITVPERRQLETHACECYAVVKEESDRLLSP